MGTEILPKEAKTIIIPAWKHPAYVTWNDLKARCANPDHRRFERYGGRGITVCEEWKNSFEAFFQNMGPTWFPGATIDRKDNDGHYNKENCQWLTRKEHNETSLRDKGQTPKPPREPKPTIPLMTLKEVCDWLQIDNQVIRKLARTGKIPGVKIGKSWRFDREELTQWVREQSHLQNV